MLGFELGHFELMRDALQAAAVDGQVELCRPGRPTGQTWTVVLTLTGPNGASCAVRSNWHILVPGSTPPRLTSAWVDD